MKWLEIKVITTNEAIEAVCGKLIDLGVQGVQIEDDLDLKNFLANNYLNWDYVDEELANKEPGDTVITFYLSKNDYGLGILKDVEKGLVDLKSDDFGIDFGTLEVFMKDVDDDDFLHNWKKYYSPFKIGKNVIVCPSWEDYQAKDAEVVFTIDPGTAFGTGLHQTTKLCTCFLEKYVTNDTELFDIGTGSGILAIISLLLGAKSAFAIDIDKNAVDVAENNAKMNNVKNFSTMFGNINVDEPLREVAYSKKYDIISANIVADVIIMIKEVAFDVLKDDGIFITSGIIKDREQDVIEALTNIGFKVKEKEQMDEWISIVFEK